MINILWAYLTSGFLIMVKKEEAIIKIFQKDCISLLVKTIYLFNSVLYVLKHSHSTMEV